jgi:hypothetical protein
MHGAVKIGSDLSRKLSGVRTQVQDNRICGKEPRAQGVGRDIFKIQFDENG